MAIINVITTHGAVLLEQRPDLGVKLAALTYEAEGFAGSSLAPTLCWTLFDERPAGAFSTGAGDPDAPLYYVLVTALVSVLDKPAKQRLGESITAALLAREGCPPTPENRNRVWVRFTDVADGDLIVGGEATSSVSLRALVAQTG